MSQSALETALENNKKFLAAMGVSGWKRLLHLPEPLFGSLSENDISERLALYDPKLNRETARHMVSDYLSMDFQITDNSRYHFVQKPGSGEPRYSLRHNKPLDW